MGEVNVCVWGVGGIWEISFLYAQFFFCESEMGLKNKVHKKKKNFKKGHC